MSTFALAASIDMYLHEDSVFGLVVVLPALLLFVWSVYFRPRIVLTQDKLFWIGLLGTRVVPIPTIVKANPGYFGMHIATEDARNLLEWPGQKATITRRLSIRSAPDCIAEEIFLAAELARTRQSGTDASGGESR